MNNNLTEINEGGSHENNKYGGVPMGIGSNGQLNTVEENETKKDNFVYSDRLYINEDLVKSSNLPGYIKGKTFANASKVINDKFKDRNDIHSNATKKELLDRLSEAQEYLKMQEQQINQSMQANMQTPEYPEQNQMFLGGDGTPLQVLQGLGASGILGQHTGINQATTALDLGQTAFGKTGIDTSGATNVDPGSVKPGMMGVTGALKGAQAGAMFGPWGAGIGAAVGGVAGLIGGGRAKKDALKGQQNFEIGQSNKMISNFAYGGNMYDNGGYLNKFKQSTMMDDPNYSGGFDFKPMRGFPYASELPLEQQIDIKSTYNPKTLYKQAFNQMRKPSISNEIGFESKLNYNDPDTVNLSPEQLQEDNGYSNPELAPQNSKPQNKLEKTLGKAGNWMKDNYGNILRYSPVAMNAMQLAKMGKPEVETLNRLGNRYNPQYMDERALTNQINAETNYGAKAMADASNGSLGALRNNILGVGLNKTKALSDAYSKVADVNRNENKTAQQFNLGVDQINMGQSNMEKDINAKNRGAHKTEKSRLLGQIGTDLGNIGKEEVWKTQAGKMTGYGYMGQFLNANPDYKAKFDSIDKDPSLDDASKYARKVELLKAKFPGATPEQIQRELDNITHLSKFGFPEETKKDNNKKAYGGYITPKFKKY